MRVFQEARKDAVTAVGKAAVDAVHIRHFLGGPCDQARCVVVLRLSADQGQSCVANVLGRSAEVPDGFRYLTLMDAACGSDLTAALVAAASRHDAACVPPPAKRPRQSTAGDEEVVDDTSSSGTAARTPSRGQVLVFWGEALWSRTQLFGELAKGDWGICRGRATDLIDMASSALWHEIIGEPRRNLVYAPPNQMSRQPEPAVTAV
eukprot:gnl/TRDRNA2_/TRDRNA2_127738_c2_seq1.p1 gnl/TRDRNA2_/TRDRNA2_127738_c2~~gnl/TRDRNA2_/TRDRNA2_127738_c2_seq1.p1  ORF type:complete len:206 (+),score=29.11 gnl/TRDRNA2_/TRDRNA2_127738_c2_seq1:56-673(+)